MNVPDISRGEEVYYHAAQDFGDDGIDGREHGRREGPPVRMGGRFCPFCRLSIPEDFVFCPHCGRDA